MAGVKISELVVLSDPELTDEIIINDLPALTTKRSTLQSIRDLANQNIDDLAEPGAGSGVTGDLEVSGDITAEGDITGQNLISENDITFGGDLIDGLGNTITDFTTLVTDDDLIQLFNTTAATEARTIDAKIDLGDVGASVPDDHYIIFRDTAFGFDSSFTSTGLTWNNDQGGILSANFFAGDGSLLTNLQYANASGVSDSAARSTRAIYSVNQQVDAIDTGIVKTYFPLFTPAANGIGTDSVNTTPGLTYTNTGVLSASSFVGDGSGLSNVTASSFTADTIKPNDISTFSALETSFNLLLHPSSNINGSGDGIAYDSVNVVQNLKYFPSTVTLSGSLNLANGKASELFLDGVADVALKTKAQEATSGSFYVMMRSEGWQAGADSGETSLITDLSFNVDGTSGPTLNASYFNGDGSAITNVAAVTATVAESLNIGNATTGIFFVPIVSSIGGSQSTFANAELKYNASRKSLDVATVQYSFNVTNNGSVSYDFSDDAAVWFPSGATANPTLYLRRGDTYKFSLGVSGHPFYIKTVGNASGTANQYSVGVTGQGNVTEPLYFAVPMEAPATLFYQCSAHSNMYGTINII